MLLIREKHLLTCSIFAIFFLGLLQIAKGGKIFTVKAELGDKGILPCPYQSRDDSTLQYIRILKVIDHKLVTVFTYIPKNAIIYGRISDRAEFVTGFYKPYLKISSLELGDEGTYICVPKFKDQLSTTNITSKLEILISPENMSIVADEPFYSLDSKVTLNCSVSRSKPAANLTWWMNATQNIPSLSHSEIVEAAYNVTRSWSILSLRISKKNMFNLYSCHSLNDDESKPFIQAVYQPKVFILPRSMELKVRQKLFEDKETNVVCLIDSVYPIPKITWKLERKNSAKAKVYKDTEIANVVERNSDGSFIIKSTLTTKFHQNEHTAKLICSTRDSVSNITNSTSSTLDIIFNPKDVKIQAYLLDSKSSDADAKNKKVEIIAMPKEKARISLNQSQSLPQFHCLSHSNPPAKVLWSVNSKVVSKENRFKLSQYPKLRETWNLSCLAFNQYGKSVHSVLIDTYFEPMCKFNATYFVEAGGEVELNCNFESNPEVTRYFWYKKNLISPENVKVEKEGKDDNILNIRRIGEEDVASYSCYARNKVGKSLTPCILDVKYATVPEAPKNCKIEESGAKLRNIIYIECDAGHYGGFQQSFKLMTKSMKQDEFKEEIISESPYFEYEALQNISYSPVFKIFAENKLGRSEEVLLFLDSKNFDEDFFQMSRTLETIFSSNYVVWIISLVATLLIIIFFITSLIVCKCKKYEDKRLLEPKNKKFFSSKSKKIDPFKSSVSSIDVLKLPKEFGNLNNISFHSPSLNKANQIVSSQLCIDFLKDSKPLEPPRNIITSKQNIFYKNLIPAKINPDCPVHSRKSSTNLPLHKNEVVNVTSSHDGRFGKFTIETQNSNMNNSNNNSNNRCANGREESTAILHLSSSDSFLPIFSNFQLFSRIGRESL